MIVDHLDDLVRVLLEPLSELGLVSQRDAQRKATAGLFHGPEMPPAEIERLLKEMRK